MEVNDDAGAPSNHGPLDAAVVGTGQVWYVMELASFTSALTFSQ